MLLRAWTTYERKRTAFTWCQEAVRTVSLATVAMVLSVVKKVKGSDWELTARP